ncbi:hypothetical protein ACFP1Z_28115 [Streptomyces gamaensis]|uniref:Uncharacterized protein n=1 Tax=Streptomyces gamaensis TaxID=1763542 RepID=A0ABW0Z951_9ACTN
MTAPRLRPIVTVPHTSGPSVIAPGDTDCRACVRLTAARYASTARGDWATVARQREEMYAHWAAVHGT